MPRSFFRLVAFAVLLAPSVFAQGQVFSFDADAPLGQTQAGVPFSYLFGEGIPGLQAAIQQAQGIPELSVVYKFALNGGSLPAGLSIAPDGLLSGTPTAPGNYAFTITWSFSIAVQGVTYFDFRVNYRSTLVVTPASTVSFVVEPAVLTFSITQGATAASAQSVSLSNRNAQPRSFSASVSGRGLSISPPNGSIAPYGVAGITVSLNPSGFTPGVYSGEISITAGDQSKKIPVLVIAASNQQNIVISQSGLTFLGVQGGGAPSAQSFNILSNGAGSYNWTLGTSTLSGSNWLSVSPPSGRSDGQNSPLVNVTVNPAALNANEYYGRIQVSSPGLPNSPQTVNVVLNVLPADRAPAPEILPTGLIFVGTAGGANPSPQNIRLNNLASTPAQFVATSFVDSTTKWLSASPANGTANSGQPLNVSVQTALTGLAAGVYSGEVAVQFATGSLRRVSVLLIVLPRPPTLASGNAAAGCTPTKLLPVFTQLASGFKVAAGWPTAIEVRLVDDCGDPATAGAVVATFSNGDPGLPLSSLRDGRYTGTWTPRSAVANVTISVRAQTLAPRLEGTSQIGGGADPNPGTPIISDTGVVSAASEAPNSPVPPGGFIAITGSQLGPADISISPSIPFPTELSDTQVILAGRPIPLYYTLAGKLAGIIPYDVAPNSTQQVVVRRGTKFSAPDNVNISLAQPAAFVRNGIAATVNVTQGAIVEPSLPVAAGDVLSIFCAGLGPVNPAVEAGTAAPSAEPLARTANDVTVTIGGRSATVLYAGLAPSLAGLYQINLTVPDGVASGNAPIVISVAGLSSPPVNLPVQ